MTNSSAAIWVRHPTDDGGGAVLVEIQAVDTASRVQRGIQIRCPVVLQRHDPDAHPTLNQPDLREMRDLARQLWQIVVRSGVVGNSVRRHREVGRIRVSQKGRIRRLGPSRRRDRPHGDPADQPDEEGNGHVATPAAVEGDLKAIPGNSQHAVFTTSNRSRTVRRSSSFHSVVHDRSADKEGSIRTVFVSAPRLQGRRAGPLGDGTVSLYPSDCAPDL